MLATNSRRVASVRCRAVIWCRMRSAMRWNVSVMVPTSSRGRLKGNPAAVLKEQYSALEEARADLVALYFLPDPKLVELGLVKGDEQPEMVQSEYESYTRN